MKIETLKQLAKHVWRADRGVLSFEWVLLITIVTIGIVGGLSAVRDSVISELGDVAGAIVTVDQSYTVNPEPCFNQNGFSFDDTQCNVAASCRAQDAPTYGQDPIGGQP